MPEPPGLDPALAAYVAATDDREADDRLGALLTETAAPAVARVVGAQLAGVGESEREDVRAGVVVRLLERLRALRRGAAEPPVASLEAYAVVTAQNACRAFLRARQPERTRLANQVRYLLRHDPAFAAWTDGQGRSLAGLAPWRGRPLAPPPGRGGDLGLATVAERAPLREVLRRLCLWGGGPWLLADLVNELARLRGVRDLPPVALSTAGGEAGELERIELAEPSPGQDRTLEERQYLGRLWAEVRELPRRQRAALLLNLRDAQGGDLLSLLPLTGVATLREIARALELGLDELEALWAGLPLDDREIGALIDATQRQVINLRKSARERLARRLKKGPQKANG